jgi:hypothetical protein
VPSNGDSVLGELVPIGNDRDHETQSYAEKPHRGHDSRAAGIRCPFPSRECRG